MSDHPVVAAAVVFCVDPRFAEAHFAEMQRLIREDFAGDLADPIASAGAGASLVVGDAFADGVMANLGASVALHKITTVVLLQHEDCGYCKIQAADGDERFAFTPETEKEKLASIARQAAEKIQETHPGISVLYRYAKLDGTIERLE